jgi:predicted transposase/invertase (TIGR01784 family)
MTLEMLKKDTYDSGFTAGEEYGRKEGIAIGEERGISIGLSQAKIETAKNLLSIGLSQEQIASVTGLSVEEIEKL